MSEFPFEFIFFPKQPNEELISIYSDILTENARFLSEMLNDNVIFPSETIDDDIFLAECISKIENVERIISDIQNKPVPDFESLKMHASKMIRNEFKEGFEKLSLLISRKIDKIIIKVYLSYHSSHAAYHPTLSNPENNFNEPCFSISSVMLKESLSNYFFLERVSFDNVLTWEHEIIHWMNSSLKLLNEEIFIHEERSPGSRFLNLVFSYRKEGVAGLFSTLSCFEDITNMESARKNFLEVFNRSFKQLKATKPIMNTLRNETLYEIGPWMILHVLSCPQNPNMFLGIDEVLLNIKNEKSMDELEQLILLEKALEIDNLTFLKYLTVPGVDGHPFITPEQMRTIRKKMGKIQNGREDIKFIQKKFPEGSKSIISIIEFYNWFGN